MTLKALAAELNVSGMTIYRRAERAGVNIKELRGPDGELTSEGVSVLASLFDTTTPGSTDATEGTSHHHNDDDNAVVVARLTAECEGLRRLVETLQAEVTDLRSRLDASEAERRQRDRLLLPAAGGGVRGWWRRHFGGDT